MADLLIDTLKAKINSLTGLPCYESYKPRTSPDFSFVMLRRLTINKNNFPIYAQGVDIDGNLPTRFVDRNEISVEVFGREDSFILAKTLKNQLMFQSTMDELGELGFAIYKSDDVTNTTVKLDSGFDFKARFIIGVNTSQTLQDNVGAIEEIFDDFSFFNSSGGFIEQNIINIGESP